MLEAAVLAGIIVVGYVALTIKERVQRLRCPICCEHEEMGNHGQD